MSVEQLLVDSNVLVYAHDRSEPAKQIRAVAVLNKLAQAGSGLLSTQVLGEFFRVATHKLTKRLTPKECRLQLREFVRSWRVLVVTPDIILEAARGAEEYQFPYYDAQIWATAKINGISTVVSENFSHHSQVEGVTFLNPFLAKLPGE